MKWRLEHKLGPSSYPSVFTDEPLSKTNAAVKAQGWIGARRKDPCKDIKSLGLTEFWVLVFKQTPATSTVACKAWHPSIEVPGWGRALELRGTHSGLSSCQILILPLTQISFLCFSKSWDNMDVRARNSALTNEQRGCWHELHEPLLIQRRLGTQPQGPRSCCPRRGWPRQRTPGCPEPCTQPTQLKQSLGLTFDLVLPAPMSCSGY